MPRPIPDNVPLRTVHSFVIRAGRMTEAQQAARDRMWPSCGLAVTSGPLDSLSVFGRHAPLVFEIGFGMGSSLVEMAKAAPEKNFVGVEVHPPGIGNLLKLVEQEGLTNMRVYQADAKVVLEQCIANGQLDCIQIFFPDPWHKTRHHKRRLIQSAFINELRPKLATGGILHLATDWEPYALQMMEGVLGVADLQVRDIMIPRSQMVTVRRDDPPEKLLPVIVESGHSRFPVVDDDRDDIVGILLAKDLLRYYAGEEEFDVRDMLRPAVFIPESKPLNVLLKEFRKNRNHIAIVVDEYGGVAGLITIEDVLEQIVGVYKTAFQQAAKAVVNDTGQCGTVKFTTLSDYRAFRLRKSEPCVKIASRAVEALGLTPNPLIMDAGLDANNFNEKGLPTVTLGTGSHHFHTVGSLFS